MGLLDKLRGGGKGAARIKSGRHAMSSEGARDALANALERERERRDPAQTVEIQLLAQVSPASDWPKIRAYWARHEQPGVIGVASWPHELPPGSHVLNLWPLRPARLTPASRLSGSPAKRQPKRLLVTPALVDFNLDEPGVTIDGALALAVANWLDGAAAKNLSGVRIAPPVLEVWGRGGQLRERRVVDFGLEFELGSAEAAH